jgi:hypothetical protein
MELFSVMLVGKRELLCELTDLKLISDEVKSGDISSVILLSPTTKYL